MTHAIHHLDALDLLRMLPDSSIDLCATDPPYYRVKDSAWDRAWDSPDAFLAWLANVVDEIARVLRPNGSLYLFASPQMSARVEVMIAERLHVLNRITWAKSASWAEGSSKGAMRAYFPASESIVFAEHYGARSLPHAMKASREAAGMSYSHVGRSLNVDGRLIDKWETQRGERDSCEPTREQFSAAMNLYGSNGLDYEDLRRPFSVTAQDAYTDVWTFSTVQAYPGKHECEKPAPLCDQIVRASGKPGGWLVDPFAGSGAILAAGVRHGMNVIGGDLDDHWCRVAEAACRTPNRRVSTAPPPDPRQPGLFG